MRAEQDQRPADRVKTDKRDAVRLARLLAAGELTMVTIPSVEREQLRDLVRCREDIRADLVRARHRTGRLPQRAASVLVPAQAKDLRAAARLGNVPPQGRGAFAKTNS